MWWELQPNGHYQFRECYTNPVTGKEGRVSVTLEKATKSYQKQARQILDQKIDVALSQALSELDDDKVNYTVKDLVNSYCSYQKRTRKGATYTRNYFSGNSFLDTFGPDTPLNKLNAKYIRKRWLDSEDDNSTLNERLKRWKGIIRYGYENDYFDDIRFLDKLKPLPDVSYREKIEDKFLETKEFLALLDGMQLEHWKLLTKFLGLSGIRIGEAIALNKSDIDFNSRIITVGNTYDSNNFVINTPKSSASYRDVYMQDDLFYTVKEINAYMLRQQLINGYPKSPLLFQNCNDGMYIKYYTYNKYIKENGLRILGREKVTPHILRHTHTCILAENGVPLETISRRLGHEDSDITKRVYMHITQKMKERDNEQISAVKVM
ncbi:MAG: site-specific integrase [Faecalicatena sp.]|uniref:tyrosine-type recombinase/integrase n=1 Tax=Faecalicatena sp. TaxID=2005360 RepID=UPI0025842B1D|nr:site-specific integrase [Faecalicatena sp.]MCI6467030.1 site-specific integrase [Faecalicatena sp.]MDY5617447.1 site-specific integrase [Lachnospiraceae bacterium]